MSEKPLASDPKPSMTTDDVATIVEQVRALTFSSDPDQDGSIAIKAMKMLPLLAQNDEYAQFLIDNDVFGALYDRLSSWKYEMEAIELVIAVFDTILNLSTNAERNTMLCAIKMHKVAAHILSSVEKDDSTLSLRVKALQLLRNMAMANKTKIWVEILPKITAQLDDDPHALIEYHLLCFLRALITDLNEKNVIKCLVQLDIPRTLAIVGGVQRVLRMPGGTTLWLHLEAARALAKLCSHEYVLDTIRSTHAIKSLSDSLLSGGQHPLLCYEGASALEVLINDDIDDECMTSLVNGVVNAGQFVEKDERIGICLNHIIEHIWGRKNVNKDVFDRLKRANMPWVQENVKKLLEL